MSGCFWKENHIIYFAAWREREHVTMSSGRTWTRIIAELHLLPQPITHHEIWMDSMTVLAAVITTFQQSRQNTWTVFSCGSVFNLKYKSKVFFKLCWTLQRTAFAYLYSISRKAFFSLTVHFFRSQFKSLCIKAYFSIKVFCGNGSMVWVQGPFQSSLHCSNPHVILNLHHNNIDHSSKMLISNFWVCASAFLSLHNIRIFDNMKLSAISRHGSQQSIIISKTPTTNPCRFTYVMQTISYNSFYSFIRGEVWDEKAFLVWIIIRS